MLRTHLEPEHEAFRELCRSFFSKECAPFVGVGDARARRPRGLAQGRRGGMLLWEAPEESGGQESRTTGTPRYSPKRFTGSAGLGFSLQSDVMAP